MAKGVFPVSQLSFSQFGAFYQEILAVLASPTSIERAVNPAPCLVSSLLLLFFPLLVSSQLRSGDHGDVLHRLEKVSACWTLDWIFFCW